MNAYLFLGYALFWTIIFAYIVLIHRQQRRTNQQLDELTQQRHD